MTIKYHLGKLSVAALCMTSLLTMTSCEDFLDTEDLTRKDSSNFPKTEADAQSALAAIYDELREMTPGEDGQSFFMTSELLSDDRFGGGGPDDRRMQAHGMGTGPHNPSLRRQEHSMRLQRQNTKGKPIS